MNSWFSSPYQPCAEITAMNQHAQLCFVFETKSPNVALAGLKLAIFL